MSEFYGAPLLAFLQSVDQGHVYRVTQKSCAYDFDSTEFRRCTSYAKLNARLGFIELGDEPEHAPKWRLTVYGRDLLGSLLEGAAEVAS